MASLATLQDRRAPEIKTIFIFDGVFRLKARPTPDALSRWTPVVPAASPWLGRKEIKDCNLLKTRWLTPDRAWGPPMACEEASVLMNRYRH